MANVSIIRIFKILFFFYRIQSLGILDTFVGEGSAVGCTSHWTHLFFDLLKHGLKIINYATFLGLPLLLLPWEEHSEKPNSLPAGLLEEYT